MCLVTLWWGFSWRHFFIAVLLFLAVKRVEWCFRYTKLSMSCLLSSRDICCSVSPVQGPCSFTLQNQLFWRKFFCLAKSGFQKCWLCDETAVKIIQNFPSLIPLDVFLSTKVLYQHNPGFWGGRCLSGLGVGSDWWVEKLFVLFSCGKTSVLLFCF